MTTPPTTFHLFPNFPAKLRARIWELNVEPRIVEVRECIHKLGPINVKGPEQGAQTVDWRIKRPPMMRHLRSPTPVPAQLQTCREAREHLTIHTDDEYRYEKAFSGITTKPWDSFDPLREGDPDRERYVWFNFDGDMLSIEDTDLHEFLAVSYQIRRLRLRRHLDNEYFSRAESLLIGRRFRNVVEVHFICIWGIRSGYLIAEYTDFPCGPENVYFIDSESMDGTMMNSVDLDAMVAREHEELEGIRE
ncbi:hypothetical protein CcaCcLH18_05276 [Colletotrichum camelliae]|nr:hypothetical protein CcaCcLH18_05276 [Colletotrichum camelliae]